MTLDCLYGGLSLYVSPAMDWQPVQGAPRLLPQVAIKGSVGQTAADPLGEYKYAAFEELHINFPVFTQSI